jgi:hypothetical protein
MKIPNPWPRISARCTCKPCDTVVIQRVRGNLEVPECDEVLIEPIKDLGRGKYLVLAEGKLWSKQWGIQDLKDHLNKMEICKAQRDIELERERDAKRKAKEARERGEAKEAQEKRAKEAKPAKVISEKPKKVVSEKPAKVVDHKMDLGDKLKL